MPHLNDARQYGYVVPASEARLPSNPYFKRVRGLNGTPEFRMTMVIKVARRNYVSNDVNVFSSAIYDNNILISQDQNIINAILRKESDESGEVYYSNINEFDIVTVSGNLCTLNTTKKFVCPICKEIIEVPGVKLYIDPTEVAKEYPIFIPPEWKDKIESNAIDYLAKKQIYNSMPDYQELLEHEINQRKREFKVKSGMNILKKHVESSNCIIVDGYVCQQPMLREFVTKGTNARTIKYSQINIAMPRPRRITYQDPGVNKDYPYITTYGEDEAQQHFECLSPGSEITVRGAIQTREYERKILCPNCGRVKAWARDTEIVSYHIEYHKNCQFPQKRNEYEDSFDCVWDDRILDRKRKEDGDDENIDE